MRKAKQDVTAKNSWLQCTCTLECLPACLYNIKLDPGEHDNVASGNPGVVKKMLARFAALESTYHPRIVAPPILRGAFCSAANGHDGFTAPYCPYVNVSTYCA